MQPVGTAVAVVAGAIAPPSVAALVFGVAQHALQGGVRERLALPPADAAPVEVVGNCAQAELALDIALENLAHNGGFRLDHFQALPGLVVAIEVVLPEEDAVFLGALEAEAGAFGDFAHFVLCDGGHDGKAELGVAVKGVDIVVLEKHADAAAQQFAGVADAVEGIPSEAADFFGDDEVEPALLRVCDHLQELFALGGGGTGNAFVDVAACERPVRVCADVFGVVCFLIFEAVQLFVLVG